MGGFVHHAIHGRELFVQSNRLSRQNTFIRHHGPVVGHQIERNIHNQIPIVILQGLLFHDALQTTTFRFGRALREHEHRHQDTVPGSPITGPRT